MLTPRLATRHGLTLLEVIVSLAIFLFALIAIGQLMSFATDRLLDARYTQHAAFLCQSKLSEVSIGSIALQSQGESDFDDGGLTWKWTLDCNQNNNVANLWTVKVKVYRDGGYGQQVAVTMTKMIIDPNYRGSTYDQPPQSAVQSGSNGGN
jgi:general secretion pathway protein I